MKITKTQLKQIIKEELDVIMGEAYYSDPRSSRWEPRPSEQRPGGILYVERSDEIQGGLISFMVNINSDPNGSVEIYSAGPQSVYLAGTDRDLGGIEAQKAWAEEKIDQIVSTRKFPGGKARMYR
jgi:hypothetical protein